MVIKIQVEVFSILILTTLICALMILMGNCVKKTNPGERPKGLANLAVIFVTMMDNMTGENMGEQFRKHFGPYIGAIAMYILLANTCGLFGLPTPTSNYSVTLVLAFITWCMLIGINIYSNGLKGYFLGLLDPVFLMLPVNIFGEIAPLISLSVRLFGNILAGGVLMTLFYAFTGWLSSFVPIIGQFNFLGPILAPVLHAYFDLFAGFMQMYIFISLTTILAGNKAA